MADPGAVQIIVPLNQVCVRDLHRLRGFSTAQEEQTGSRRPPQGLGTGIRAALWTPARCAQALTQEVAHHLRRVVGGGCDAQELLPPRHRRVIDGLDVDVVSAHQLITDGRVFSSICNLHVMTERDVSMGWSTPRQRCQ